MKFFDNITLAGVLALIVTGAVVALVVIFSLHPPDPSNQIITGLVSTVTTVFVMVFSFFFGSSSGSKEKDETISKIAATTTGTGNGNGHATTTTP